jgi:hypothetical protein
MVISKDLELFLSASFDISKLLGRIETQPCDGLCFIPRARMIYYIEFRLLSYLNDTVLINDRQIYQKVNTN